MRRSFSHFEDTFRTVLTFACLATVDDNSSGIDTPDLGDLDEAPTANTESTEEEEEEEEEASANAKPKKVPYPFKKDEEGHKIKLDVWPEDWCDQTHKGLLRSDFAKEEVWLRRKAKEAQATHDKYIKEAEQLEAMGSVEERKKAKKAQGLQTQLATLIANSTPEQLEALGLTEMAAVMASNKDE